MPVGYARKSTTEQHFDLQRDALTQGGCGRLFTDSVSGAKAECPGLPQALNSLREGDVLAVWKLDRRGRSLKDLIETVTALEHRGIGCKSLQESMDTTTPGGS
jgi:DNA invertase Pin-like site-specific DNA recombinase